MPTINSFNGASVKDWGLIRNSSTAPIITGVTTAANYITSFTPASGYTSSINAIPSYMNFNVNFFSPDSLGQVSYAFKMSSTDGSTASNGAGSGAYYIGGTLSPGTTSISSTTVFGGGMMAMSGLGGIIGAQITGPNIYITTPALVSFFSSYTCILSLTNKVGTTNYTFVLGMPVTNEITITGRYNTVSGDITGSWICPPGVTRVSVVAVGAGGGTATGSGYGGGGGGGALTYGNNLTVVPGTAYSFNVGSSVAGGAGGNTWFISSSSFFAGGGGLGVAGNNNTGGGGGGAGGYAGNGGAGGSVASVNYIGGSGGISSGSLRTSGFLGGVGGGGSSTSVATLACPAVSGGAGAGGSGGWPNPYQGGGVGIWGQSSVDSLGNATAAGTATAINGNAVGSYNGGSGGTSSADLTSANPNYFGAGASSASPSIAGGPGALRIIWSPIGSGITRAFPSTNVRVLS
jgi:hypothetical protein